MCSFSDGCRSGHSALPLAGLAHIHEHCGARGQFALGVCHRKAFSAEEQRPHHEIGPDGSDEEEAAYRASGHVVASA
jgi:hypothetical protein